MISQRLHGADVNATQAQTNLLNRRAQASTAEACISPLCVGFLDSTTLACLVCKMFGRPNARKDELTNAQLQAKSTSALNAYADAEQTLTEERAAFSVAQIRALVDQVSARAHDMLTQAKAEGIDSLDRVAISHT
jgi:NH3-dependent NAD+ synthetase